MNGYVRGWQTEVTTHTAESQQRSAQEKLVQDTLLKLADEMLLSSAHDCSDGGLTVAIAECCFSSLGRKAIGAEIDLASNGLANESHLFGESPSRIIISFAPDKLERIQTSIGQCAFQCIGKVCGHELSILVDEGLEISVEISELESAWGTSLHSTIEN